MHTHTRTRTHTHTNKRARQEGAALSHRSVPSVKTSTCASSPVGSLGLPAASFDDCDSTMFRNARQAAQRESLPQFAQLTRPMTQFAWSKELLSNRHPSLQFPEQASDWWDQKEITGTASMSLENVGGRGEGRGAGEGRGYSYEGEREYEGRSSVERERERARETRLDGEREWRPSPLVTSATFLDSPSGFRRYLESPPL